MAKKIARFAKCSHGKVWHRSYPFMDGDYGITRCGMVVVFPADIFSSQIPDGGKFCKQCERKS